MDRNPTACVKLQLSKIWLFRIPVENNIVPRIRQRECVSIEIDLNCAKVLV